MGSVRPAENLYCFAANNPVMFTDPAGLLPNSNPVPYYDWNAGVFHPGDEETGTIRGKVHYNYRTGQYEDEAGSIHPWYKVDSWNSNAGNYQNRITVDVVAAYFNAYWYGYAYNASAVEKDHKKGFNVFGTLHKDGSEMVRYAPKEWLTRKLYGVAGIQHAGDDPFGDGLAKTDKHFNGAVGTVGVAILGYNQIPNDIKRMYAYKFSKMTGLKAGKIFQGTKSFVNGASSAVKALGVVGTVIGVGAAGYEIATDTWDAHTVVNAGLIVSAAAATIFAAPAVLTGMAIYGVADYFF
jgi:hypothetical protein